MLILQKAAGIIVLGSTLNLYLKRQVSVTDQAGQRDKRQHFPADERAHEGVSCHSFWKMCQHTGSGATSAAQWGSEQLKYLIWDAWPLKRVVLLRKDKNSLFKKKKKYLQLLWVGSYSYDCPMRGPGVGEWGNSPAQRERGETISQNTTVFIIALKNLYKIHY